MLGHARLREAGAPCVGLRMEMQSAAWRHAHIAGLKRPPARAMDPDIGGIQRIAEHGFYKGLFALCQNSAVGARSHAYLMPRSGRLCQAGRLRAFTRHSLCQISYFLTLYP